MIIYLAIDRARIKQHIQYSWVWELTQFGYAGQGNGLETFIDPSWISMQLPMPRYGQKLNASIYFIRINKRFQMALCYVVANVSEVVNWLKIFLNIQIFYVKIKFWVPQSTIGRNLRSQPSPIPCTTKQRWSIFSFSSASIFSATSAMPRFTIRGRCASL